MSLSVREGVLVADVVDYNYQHNVAEMAQIHTKVQHAMQQRVSFDGSRLTNFIMTRNKNVISPLLNSRYK
jgi:hypothetical protein